MKNIGAFISIFVSVVIVASLVILYRRNKYEIKEGELQGEDAIGMSNVTGTWDSKSNEVINKLHPKVRQAFTSFINDLNGQGIKYRAYSGTRTFEEQAALYAKGRTEPGKIVTNAKPGSSYHNYGLATDGVQIKDGKAAWFLTKKGQPLTGDEKKIVDTAAKYGLYWGGNISTIYDTPHFEYQQFGSVSQLLALYNGKKIDSNGYLIV